MLILYIILYFVNTFLVIKSEDNVVKIEILKDKHPTCKVEARHKLVEGRNFTLNIKSDYFFNESHWLQDKTNKKNVWKRLEHLENSNFRISYEKSVGRSKQEENETFVFSLSHTEEIDSHFGQHWQFKFHLFMMYDPWSLHQKEPKTIKCETIVTIEPANDLPGNSAEPAEFQAKGYHQVDWPVIIGPIIGILSLIQTAYIVYIKVRGRVFISNKKNIDGAGNMHNNDKGRDVNIAKRPPLPLPPNDIPKAPPPMPVQNYNGSRVHMSPKQSYRNKALDTSEEPVRAPGIRRQAEVKPMQLPPYPSVCAKSFNQPKPLPRLSPTPKKAAIPPTPRQGQSPCFSLPKKPPIFPPTQQAIRDSYDDEWEYETLQPTSKYI